MAVFERKATDKICIDDSKPIIFEFQDAVESNGHVEYLIKVHREPDWDKKWIVKHRYSDFEKLHVSLSSPTIKLPTLPPKKVFGNKDKEFIDYRRYLLQKYLEQVFTIPYVSSSLQARRFLDPESYEINFLEEARQNILVVLRSGGSHEITQTIPSMGTRIRKYNFMGYPLSDPKTLHLLWWAKYGPDKSAHLRDIHTALTALLHCHHFYIVSAIACVATESGVCVIRPWFNQGSLRDYIYGVKPQFESVIKYTNNKRREISISTCAVYGRQILEALSFLHEKGIGHGALHSGNVILDNNVCKLIELENQILGLPHLLRPYMTKIKKINSMESIDIYCFGHLLYEMVFHDPLESETCNNFPTDCGPLCRSVLESILSSEACKCGLPTAAALLTHPFFNQVPLLSYAKPSLKLSSSVKETFNLSYENTLLRLKDDQKKIKLRKLQSKADAILSEEPMKVNTSKNSEKSSVLSTSESSSAMSIRKSSPSDSASDWTLNTSVNENQSSVITADKDLLIAIQINSAAIDEEEIKSSVPYTTNETSTTKHSLLIKGDLLSAISNFDKANLHKNQT